MRFNEQLEAAFQAVRNASLTRADTGVAALSCCLWLTQLISFAHSRQRRSSAKSGLLLALNFLPLFEGQNWQICRGRGRCLTIFKLVLFMLLGWEAGGGRGGTLAGALTGGSSDVAVEGALPPAASSAAAQQSLSLDAAWACALHRQCPVSGGAHGAAGPGGGPGEEEWRTLSTPDPVKQEGSLGDGEVGWMSLSACLTESKLFALLHAGLAYRYSRWQQTAALQTALVAAAMAQTAWQDVCRAPPLASPTGRHTVRTAASLLTNAHLLPLVYTAPASEPGSGGSGGGGSEEEEGGPLLLQVPEGVDQCRLLLTWVQLCLGWAAPIWAAVLSEMHARARFAAVNIAHLQAEEKEWAVRAAVGYEWWAALYQFPMLCLTVWHIMLAGAAALARAGSG